MTMEIYPWAIFENPGYIILATVVSITWASVSTVLIAWTVVQVTF